jgi:phosphinothricin acetyltransferase
MKFMIKVRDFQKEDTTAVAKLIPQLTRNVINPTELPNRLTAMGDYVNTRAIVAVDGDRIVGFAEIAWYIIPSKGLISWIEEVVVDAEYRGQGVGRMLMQKVLEIAQLLGCRQIKLTAANFVAQKLYESLGFQYKETEVMIKNI